MVERRRERTSQILSRVISLPEERPSPESVPDGEMLFVLDRGGRILFVNEAVARVSRMQCAEMVGKNLSELNLPSGLLSALDAQRERLFSTGTGLREDIALVTARGNETFEHICSPVAIQDPAGGSQIQAMISNFRRTYRTSEPARPPAPPLPETLSRPLRLWDVPQAEALESR